MLISELGICFTGPTYAVALFSPALRNRKVGESVDPHLNSRAGLLNWGWRGVLRGAVRRGCKREPSGAASAQG